MLLRLSISVYPLTSSYGRLCRHSELRTRGQEITKWEQATGDGSYPPMGRAKDDDLDIGKEKLSLIQLRSMPISAVWRPPWC